MKAGSAWCLTAVHLCFSNQIFIHAGSDLEDLHNEIYLLRREITSVTAHHEIMMRALEETIGKLDDLWGGSTKEEKDYSHIKPSKPSKDLPVVNNAPETEHLPEEPVRIKCGHPEKKHAQKQYIETIVKRQKNEANGAITLIAESFMSSVSNYCDDQTKYTGNKKTEACLRSFFQD